MKWYIDEVNDEEERRYIDVSNVDLDMDEDEEREDVMEVEVWSEKRGQRVFKGIILTDWRFNLCALFLRTYYAWKLVPREIWGKLGIQVASSYLILFPW